MKKIAFIFGGSGYIGKFLIRNLVESEHFDAILNFDLVEWNFVHMKYQYIRTDVREPIEIEVGEYDTVESWIFNLAALCREPGFEAREYFDTNIKGAENVCSFAERVGCHNIFFTSTMSSYGYIPEPTIETAGQYPETPYGVSKLVGEKIHQTWFASGQNRRLIICRPSVIFGPRDVGNVKRMVKAIKRGYFFFPGDPHITKAYGYIYDFVKSVNFVLEKKKDPYIVYNFAQHPLLNLEGMSKAIKRVLGKKSPIPRMPISLLIFIARIMQFISSLFRRTSPIHPVRVKKMAFPTNIKPQYLIDRGFVFSYTFESALQHWKQECEEDFT